MGTSKAMVSRSLRLHKHTLDRLKQEADKQGIGITVYIRRVLESLVDNLDVHVQPTPYGENSAHYPEL